MSSHDAGGHNSSEDAATVKYVLDCLLSAKDELRLDTELQIARSEEKMNSVHADLKESMSELKNSLETHKLHNSITIVLAAAASIVTMLGMLWVSDQMQDAAYSSGFGAGKTIAEDRKSTMDDFDKRLAEIQRLVQENSKAINSQVKP